MSHGMGHVLSSYGLSSEDAVLSRAGKGNPFFALQICAMIQESCQRNAKGWRRRSGALRVDEPK